jgi:hypothetical protein
MCLLPNIDDWEIVEFSHRWENGWTILKILKTFNIFKIISNIEIFLDTVQTLVISTVKRALNYRKVLGSY